MTAHSFSIQPGFGPLQPSVMNRNHAFPRAASAFSDNMLNYISKGPLGGLGGMISFGGLGPFGGLGLVGGTSPFGGTGLFRGTGTDYENFINQLAAFFLELVLKDFYTNTGGGDSMSGGGGSMNGAGGGYGGQSYGARGRSLWARGPMDLCGFRRRRRPRRRRSFYIPDKPPGTSGVGPPADNSQKGKQVKVDKPITVKKGEVFDGKGKTYVAGKSLGDGGQGENQKPVFILEDGARLRNVNLIGENGGGAADGVHTYGDAQLDNVHWLNVGEDALTKKSAGHIVMRNCSMKDGDDKGIQDNAPGSIEAYNCHFENLGKAYRTNGGQKFEASIEFYDCTFENMKHEVGRSDSDNFTGLMTNCTLTDVKSKWQVPSSANVS